MDGQREPTSPWECPAREEVSPSVTDVSELVYCLMPIAVPSNLTFPLRAWLPHTAPLAKGSNGTFSAFAASKASATCASQIYHTTLTAPAVPPTTLSATWTPPAGAKGAATFKLLWSEGPAAAKKYVSIVQKSMAATDTNTTVPV